MGWELVLVVVWKDLDMRDAISVKVNTSIPFLASISENISTHKNAF
jgi:hypothetical protein